MIGDNADGDSTKSEKEVNLSGGQRRLLARAVYAGTDIICLTIRWCIGAKWQGSVDMCIQGHLR